MRPRRTFRPSESWSLEDRVVLSHAGAHVAALAASAHGLSVTFHGKAIVHTTFGVDTLSELASLSGSAILPQVGPTRLAGVLSSNTVFPSFGQTLGSLNLSTRKRPGTLTLNLAGPRLPSATPSASTRLAFKVVSATGQFAFLAGGTGVADLTLQAHFSRPKHLGQPATGHGSFTLVLTSG